jgi:hypothetical protein
VNSDTLWAILAGRPCWLVVLVIALDTPVLLELLELGNSEG